MPQRLQYSSSLCAFPLPMLKDEQNSQPFFLKKLLNPKNRIFNEKDPTAPPCRSVDEAFAQPSKERACCSLKSHQISPNKSSNIPPNPEAIYGETVIKKIYELPRVTSMPVSHFPSAEKSFSNNADIHTLLWFCGRLGQKSPAEKMTIPHARRRDFR